MNIDTSPSAQTLRGMSRQRRKEREGVLFTRFSLARRREQKVDRYAAFSFFSGENLP